VSDKRIEVQSFGPYPKSCKKLLAKRINLRLQIDQNKIEMLKSVNATIITCCCRVYLAQVKVGRLRHERNEVLRFHFIIETIAATQSEAFWRGCLCRRLLIL